MIKEINGELYWINDCFKCLEHSVCPQCNKLVHSYNHKTKIGNLTYHSSCYKELNKELFEYYFNLPPTESEFYKQGFE